MKHESKRFEALGRLCARHAWLVLGLWVALAGVLNLAVPQLEKVVSEHSAPFVAQNLEAVDTLRTMAADFGTAPTTGVGSVVISDPAGISDADRAYYGRLIAKLHADREHVAWLLDTYSRPETRAVGLSPDGKAINLVFAVTGDAGSTQAHHATTAVRAMIDESGIPSGTEVHYTGPSPTLADLFSAIDYSLLIITVISVLLITLVLLVVYRSLWTALIPLLTIGLGLAVARPVIGLLGMHDVLSVSNFTIAIGTALTLGAGTDYAIFAIAAYHEGRRRGIPAREAAAYSSMKMSTILIASALTIAAACCSMAFAQIGMFRTAGPPTAVAVAVTLLVALTVPPAALRILGERGKAEPQALDEGAWRRRGARIVRHAVPITAACLAILVAAAALLPTLRIGFDENRMQLQATDSKIGYDRAYEHWGVNEVSPEYILIRSDHDMRNTRDLAALELAASQVASLPQIALVRSITRPDGKPIAESAVGFHTGQVADRLADGAKQITDATPQLKQLAAGVAQLHDGAQQASARLPELKAGTDQVVALADGVLSAYSAVEDVVRTATDGREGAGEALGTAANAIDAVRAALPAVTRLAAQVDPRAREAKTVLGPLVTAEPSAACRADAQCMRARAALAELDAATGGRVGPVLQRTVDLQPVGAVTLLATVVDKVETAVTSLRGLMNQLGDRTPEQVRADLQRLTAGVTELQSGMTRLTAGLGEVRSGTGRMLTMTGALQTGLQQAVDYLRGVQTATGDGAGRGFYLPAQGLDDPRFVTASRLLMSPDGKSARMLAVWKINPYGSEALDAAPQLTSAARNALRGTGLEGADVRASGLTSLSAQMRDQVWKDFALFALIAVLAVLILLCVLLRSLVAPLVMVAAVIISFAAAAGVSTLVWQHIIGIDLDWSVLPVAFMALVAVGADYSMLFAARIREESGSGMISGILRGFGSTGSVITTAGIVFALTMLGLLGGTVINLLQIGSTIALGLILDITVVRTYLLPSVMAIAGNRIWWPAKA